VGFGYDVHRRAQGRLLVLGGVRFRTDWGLVGHSDADVLCHAIGDALLGAVALGDLGTHFPPGDARWKDASSLDLLRFIRSMLDGIGAEIVNVDGTVIVDTRLEPQLNEVVGAQPAEAQVTFETVQEDGGYRLAWQLTRLTPEYPARELAASTAMAWITARQQCSTSTADQYDGSLLGDLGVDEELCGVAGQPVAGEVGGLAVLADPTFVIDFPKEVSPLAKEKRGEPDLVERIGARLRDIAARETDPVLAGYALLAVAGIALARRWRPVALLLALPYLKLVAGRARSGGEPTLAVHYLAHDLISLATTARGDLRHRVLVI